MATDLARTRRKFDSAWDEIKYLYHKLLYWFYERGSRREALRFCDRLEALLQEGSPEHEAILGEECWSLLSEVRGDLAAAIRYREHEIELIRKLMRVVARSPRAVFALKGYGYADLSDRLDLLAGLYHDAGDLDKAIKVLRQSKELCQQHGVPFDGQDMLDEYLAEMGGDAGR